MKLLTVIIVTYNSNDIILKCLENIYLFNDIGDDLEVLIVDNSTQQVAEELFSKVKAVHIDVICLKNSKNGGYGQGNNFGITHANGKYLAIMNPDIILTENLFHCAISHFSNTKIAMMGFKQLGGANLSMYFRPEFYCPLFTSVLTKCFNKYDYFNKNFMFLSGAFLFVNKLKFEEVGLFDEKLFLYCEESDISMRFIRKGYDIVYDNSKSYIHEIEDRKEMSDVGYNILVESILHYLNKFSLNRLRFLRFLHFDLFLKIIISTVNRNKNSIKIYENQIEIIKKNMDKIKKKYDSN